MILTDFKHIPCLLPGRGEKLSRLSLLEVAERLTQLLTLVGLDLLEFSFSSAGHGAYLCVRCSVKPGLNDQFIQRIFNNALGAVFFQRRDNDPYNALVNDRLNGDPTFSCERRYGWILKRGKVI